jgi:hypothetical protein
MFSIIEKLACPVVRPGKHLQRPSAGKVRYPVVVSTECQPRIVFDESKQSFVVTEICYAEDVSYDMRRTFALRDFQLLILIVRQDQGSVLLCGGTDHYAE